MVRSTAHLIQKTVFLSVNNPRTPMAEAQLLVQGLIDSLGAADVSGIVLAGTERWLCLIEGPAAQVEEVTSAIELKLRPKEWHVLMTDARARARMFPDLRIGWRSGCSHLEMVALVSDLRRHGTRTQLWFFDANETLHLLEPDD